MNIRLIKISEQYRDQLTEMIAEWKRDLEINHTDRSPRAIFKNDPADFESYVENLEQKEEKDGFVPDSVFFCLDEDRDRLVGAVNIRHSLSWRLCLTGGHIGDGIRPSERRKGYATAMIGLALDECRKLGLDQVLMVCDRENTGSAKSIMKNGGVLESEVEEDGRILQRYWISLREETLLSERLLLRRVMPYDYREMAAWTQDGRVYQYLLGSPAEKPEDALEFLRKNDPNSKTKYIMIEHARSDGHPVGLVSCVRDDDGSCWEISYLCRYDDWGKGYTTEGIRTLMEYVREKHGAVSFRGECAAENIGSARVMEKLGMKYCGDSSYAKHDGSAVYASKIYLGCPE